MDVCNQNNPNVKSSWDNIVNSARMFINCPSSEVFGRYVNTENNNVNTIEWGH